MALDWAQEAGVNRSQFRLRGFFATAVLAALIIEGGYPNPASGAGQSEPAAAEETLEVATFAGGCFWCVESDFDAVAGVARTVSGYTGGHVENPTYGQVSSDTTGHREAVQIYFDPNRVAFADLLQIFWRTIDPTDAGGQFCDRGKSYTTAVFANSEQQRRAAEASKKMIQSSGILGQPVVTTIETAGPFYPAEDYHQDYYTKNPLRYKFYRFSCGRDARVKDLWGEQAHRGIATH
jgi:peptide-methionine (S)-S-oxide reductase